MKQRKAVRDAKSAVATILLLLTRQNGFLFTIYHEVLRSFSVFKGEFYGNLWRNILSFYFPKNGDVSILLRFKATYLEKGVATLVFPWGFQ